MTSKLEEKKRKIDEQIEKSILRKKMLLAKEKRKRASKFSNIGRLAYQANIDTIDEKTLLGAFLEIAKNLNDEKISQWQNNAEEFLNFLSKKTDQSFCILFLEEPSLEVKQKLKETKFQWNRFRKEYYGKCQKAEIEKLLNGCKFKLEEIVD